MAHHIFQLESELQNIPEAAPEAWPSFIVSENSFAMCSSASGSPVVRAAGHSSGGRFSGCTATVIQRVFFRRESSLGLQFGYAKQKRGNVFEEMTRSLGNGIDNCS